MIPKKDCTKTVCPLCESRCQVGSTDSGFIENNGACFRCVFGKSKEQIQALLLAKEKSRDETPVQAVSDIEWAVGKDEKCRTIAVVLCSECEKTVPADSVLMKLDAPLATAINELRQAIDNDSVVSLVKAAYRILDAIPTSEVKK